MTLRLILIRHAKSSWDNHALSDHDRPLNARGRRSATAIGKWLAAQGHVPREVLCSTSKRTRETWDRIAREMPAKAHVELIPELYHASPGEMLGVLQSAGAKVVAMVAHNPGSGIFAGELASAPPDHPRFHDYPTCATTVMEFDAARWADVDWGQGAVVDFAIPRELGA